MTPFLLLLSSPSGGGKTTVAKALVAAREDLEFSVSATTRAAREGEVDGVDYYFLSRAEFLERREKGEFLEWAEYGEALYGTLNEEVDRVISHGKHLILDVEVQGARQVRARREDVVSVFILPPSAETLLKRLVGRDDSMHPDRLRQRLVRAVEELEEAPEYDYIVVNEDRTQVVSEVAAIIDSESKRTNRNANLQEDLARLRQDVAAIAGEAAAL
ncbi:MAG: guanylate kinase [Gemmatimonadota bacterium]|nr:MAG: guanylate kinase [Gemmatimonadota bacterium]